MRAVSQPPSHSPATPPAVRACLGLDLVGAQALPYPSLGTKINGRRRSMIAGGSNTHPVSRRILSLIDQHPYLSTLAAMPDGPESGILLTKFCTLRGLDIEVVKEELAKLRQPLGGAQESATRLPGGGSAPITQVRSWHASGGRYRGRVTVQLKRWTEC